MTLDTFLKSEWGLHQLENRTDYANGFRTRTTNGFGKEVVLIVPFTRSDAFYPAFLVVLRNDYKEHRKLIFRLYRKGLTTEQVSNVYKKLYSKHYSKQQISYLIKESKKEIELWLKRDLEEHYLVLYVDATFGHTRRVIRKKEGYFTIFGIK